MRKVGARCAIRPNRVDPSARHTLKRWRPAIVLKLDGLMLRVGEAQGVKGDNAKRRRRLKPNFLPAAIAIFAGPSRSGMG
jgi:hypothetical protein